MRHAITARAGSGTSSRKMAMQKQGGPREEARAVSSS